MQLNIEQVFNPTWKPFILCVSGDSLPSSSRNVLTLQIRTRILLTHTLELSQKPGTVLAFRSLVVMRVLHSNAGEERIFFQFNKNSTANRAY